jgi:hypothetical protein
MFIRVFFTPAVFARISYNTTYHKSVGLCFCGLQILWDRKADSHPFSLSAAKFHVRSAGMGTWPRFARGWLLRRHALWTADAFS